MRYILLLFLIISTNGYSQCKTFIIGIKGDTLNCTDRKDKKQGRWIIEMPELRGEKGYEEQGVFLNDKKEGTWQRFTPDGDLLAIENYRWGNKNGKSVYFTPFGQRIREESWKAVNPDNPYDTVDVFDLKDPSKVVERAVVKLDGFTLRHGIWKFYDTESGTLEKTEQYHLDKLRTANDDLAPIDIGNNNIATVKSDTATKKTIAKPKAVLDYEKKNAGKKNIKVRDGRTGG
jgi:hypothetical protein